MRKQILLAVAAIAVLALVAAPAFAGPFCSAKTASADKAACSAKFGKLASADGKAACLAKYGMTEEECRAMCKEIGDNCVLTNISIKGMTCGGCEKSVTAALLETPGVVKVVKVSHKDGMALVAIDPKKVENNGLIQAVSNKGFEAQIIPAVAITGSSAKLSGSKYSCSAHADFSSSKASCSSQAKAGGKACCAKKGSATSAKATGGTKSTQVSASTGTK